MPPMMPAIDVLMGQGGRAAGEGLVAAVRRVAPRPGEAPLRRDAFVCCVAPRVAICRGAAPPLPLLPPPLLPPPLPPPLLLQRSPLGCARNTEWLLTVRDVAGEWHDRDGHEHGDGLRVVFPVDVGHSRGKDQHTHQHQDGGGGNLQQTQACGVGWVGGWGVGGGGVGVGWGGGGGVGWGWVCVWGVGGGGAGGGACRAWWKGRRARRPAQ